MPNCVSMRAKQSSRQAGLPSCSTRKPRVRVTLGRTFHSSCTYAPSELMRMWAANKSGKLWVKVSPNLVALICAVVKSVRSANLYVPICELEAMLVSVILSKRQFTPVLKVCLPFTQVRSSTNWAWPTLRPFGKPAPKVAQPVSDTLNSSGIKDVVLAKSATPKMAVYQEPEPMKLFTRVGVMAYV